MPMNAFAPFADQHDVAPIVMGCDLDLALGHLLRREPVLLIEHNKTSVGGDEFYHTSILIDVEGSLRSVSKLAPTPASSGSLR